MDNATPTAPVPAKTKLSRSKIAAAAVFMFFLIKGLLWLAIPAVAAFKVWASN